MPLGDGRLYTAASQAAAALLQLANSTAGAAAQSVLQQPGIMEALAGLLQPQHSLEAQGAGLAVLGCSMTRFLTAGAAAASSPEADQVVQQLARQPGIAGNLVRMLSSPKHGEGACYSAMRLLDFLVHFDRATARQLLDQPAAVAALAGVLGSKQSDERRLAANVLLAASKGACT